MPLDFPTSPTNGQTYNGYVYSTSVGAWQAKPAAQSPFYTSDTPPSNPVDGDSWFNTNDGTMYIYVNDGNTSQWVEHRSEIARSQVGLVPIRPSSVTVTSGTASIAVDGTITLAGCGDAILNGVFTSAYKNYKIIFNDTALTLNTNYGAVLYFRFSTAGTTDQTYNYSYTNWYTQSGSNGNGAGGTANNWGILGYFKDFTMEIASPAIASRGTELSFTGLYNNTLMLAQGGLNKNIAVDGIQFANNFITGTMKVYGYN